MFGVYNFDNRYNSVDTPTQPRTQRQQQSCLSSRWLSEGKLAPIQFVKHQSVDQEGVSVDEDVLDGEEGFADWF